MKKIDVKKELAPLYQPSAKTAGVVEVPPLNYLMVDGEGDPNTAPAYAEAVEALFSVSYAIKFAIKKGPLAIDYGVMPLEGLWWADDPSVFVSGNKNDWRWTLMILQPPPVTPDVVETAIADVKRKKNLPAIDRLRLQRFDEGRCAQILHVGPFSEEGPTVEKLHRFIDGHGKLRGRHHEIYLSDIRRAAPEKWKTIIRQPFE